MYDVFISHASEDKQSIVAPLTQAFESHGITYWLDSDQILWGYSTTDKINEGLKNSKYIIVILSEAYVSKYWPLRELNSALSKEIQSGQISVLPLYACGTESKRKIIDQLPIIHDKLHLTWDNQPEKIVNELKRLLELSDDKPDATKKRRDMPIPQIKQKITQYEKDNFIKETFTYIKDYFREGLSQLEETSDIIKTDFTEILSTTFLCKIYVNGNKKAACKIWISNNEIRYSYDDSASFGLEAYNEAAYISDDEYKLGLRLMMSFETKHRNTSLTQEEVAEDFWKGLTEALSR